MGSSGGAETTLRILADASQVTSTFKKVGDQWQSVGEKAIKSTEKLQTNLMGMGKGMLTVAAGIAAINTAANIANNILDRAKNNAGAKNSQVLNAEAAALHAGGSRSNNINYINSTKTGVTTQSGRTAFLAKIGEIQDGRRAQGIPALTEAQIEQMRSLYTQGGDVVFGQNGEKIISSAQANVGQPMLGVGRQLAGMNGVNYSGTQDNGALAKQALGGAMNKELATALAQQQLADQASRRAQANSRGGQAVIAADAEAERWKQENPGKAAVLPYIPGGEATLRGDNIKPGDDHLKAIRKAIEKQSSRAGNPTLPNLKARE